MTQLGLFVRESTIRQSYEQLPVYKVTLVRESSVPLDQPHFRSSQNAATMLQAYLKDANREHCVVLLLNRKNRLIGLNTVSIGSLTASVVHPREVFKPAILGNAAAVILCHNHPSGDPAPSQEDRVLTKRLVEAGKLLGIDILDHIIVGDGRYFSFADEGLL